jgi:hypothetical protein
VVLFTSVGLRVKAAECGRGNTTPESVAVREELAG